MAPPHPSSSPQSPALLPEGVEPIVAGLGALCGDGQQVGGAAAAGLDAACKAAHSGLQVSGAAGRGFPRTLPSEQGQEVTLPMGTQEEQSQLEEARHQAAGVTETPSLTVTPGDQAARAREGLGVQEALTAVLGVMAAQGEGEGWGGWAGPQDRG